MPGPEFAHLRDGGDDRLETEEGTVMDVTKWREGAVVERVGEDKPNGPKRGERGVLLTPDSLKRDPSTGDWAEWAVDFGFEGPTGYIQLRNFVSSRVSLQRPDAET